MLLNLVLVRAIGMPLDLTKFTCTCTNLHVLNLVKISCNLHAIRILRYKYNFAGRAVWHVARANEALLRRRPLQHTPGQLPVDVFAGAPMAGSAVGPFPRVI